MNKYYSTIFILTICLLFSFLYCPPLDVFYDDKEIFQYIGRLIDKGYTPYRDVFDHKPPLIFFLNFLGQLLGPWGLWLLDTFLVLLASLLFLDQGKKFRLPYPWILPFLFNLLIRNFLVSEGIGMTREYTAIFLLLFFCVLLGKSRYRHLLLGLLTALTFFMQQDQVLPLLPFWVYALAGDDPVPLIKRILHAGAGFLAVTLLIIGYFAATHSLTYFWEDAFIFNFSWYTEKKSWLDHFKSIKDGMDATGYKMAFIISVALGISALFLQNKKKRLVFAALLAVLLSFSAEYLSGKLLIGQPFYYYFLPLAASIPILVFTVFAFTEDGFLRDKKSQLLYGALLSCSLAYTVLQHTTHLSRHNADWIKETPEFQYLQQQHLKDYQLYIFDHSGFIYAYNRFGILAPSRWIYHHFWRWYPHWDTDHHILQSIEQDLQKHQTTYILDRSDNIRAENPAAYNLWQSFLQDHYQPVQLPLEAQPGANEPSAPVNPKIILWKLKGIPG
ncbi:MAG TPA: hypothetical protein VL832_00195 [Puia sp.]|nr:hypothetical protein [Puia sp.]